MEVKIVDVTGRNFNQIPRPVKKGFNCQECFYWMGKRDGKLDLVKQKRKWFLRRVSQYGSLAKLLLWGKRKTAIAYIQFGPIAEFQTAKMFYREQLPIPRGGWCITCISLQTAYQGKGLAKKLINNVLRDLKRRGIRAVDVYDMPEFWQSFNFEKVLEDKKKNFTILRKKLR